jgi:hypothetical protein
LDPTPEAWPYVVEMRTSGVFVLSRCGPDDEAPGAAEFWEELIIDIRELPALRTVLGQVADHPHFTRCRWDVNRSWLTPARYTEEQIAAANEPWNVRRFDGAIVVGGPLWNPHVFPSGAFAAEVEYARLEELITALDGLAGG